MTKISNCEDCYYKSTHSEMGASWNVCTLHKDLSSATIACENSDNCKSKITYKEVNQAIKKQIPKKVLTHNGYIECPYCETDIKEDKGNSYCSICGQALDWSEEE